VCNRGRCFKYGTYGLRCRYCKPTLCSLTCIVRTNHIQSDDTIYINVLIINYYNISMLPRAPAVNVVGGGWSTSPAAHRISDDDGKPRFYRINWSDHLLHLWLTPAGALGHHNIIIISSIERHDEAADGRGFVQPTIGKSNEDNNIIGIITILIIPLKLSCTTFMCHSPRTVRVTDGRLYHTYTACYCTLFWYRDIIISGTLYIGSTIIITKYNIINI